MIKVTNNSGSVGDCLGLTPLFKKEKGVIVMLKNYVTENILSKLYDGVADIEFVDKPVEACPETNDTVCYSQRILNYFKMDDISPIPFVRITDEEKSWAKDFLKSYENPIAFNGAVGKPDGHELARYREIPTNICDFLIGNAKKTNSVLQFGLSSNYRKFDGVVNILDLPIRQLVACYSVIGKYIGSDTGDYHLMLAVGGKCDVFIPPSTWHYNHGRHLYLSYAWKNEPSTRVNYYVFNK